MKSPGLLTREQESKFFLLSFPGCSAHERPNLAFLDALWVRPARFAFGKAVNAPQIPYTDGKNEGEIRTFADAY